MNQKRTNFIPSKKPPGLANPKIEDKRPTNTNNENRSTNISDSTKSKSQHESNKQTKICLICAQTIPSVEREKIFAYGKCNHSVCYVCCARLRVLCEQLDCPICREKLDNVIFTSTAKPYEQCSLKDYIHDTKHNIYFANSAIKDAFKKLFEYQCLVCLKQTGEKATHKNKQNSRILAATVQDSTSGLSKTIDSSILSKNQQPDKRKPTRSPEINLEDDLQGLTSIPDLKKKSFDDIFNLKNHLLYVHKLELCDYCFAHSKLFPFEYSYYDKKSMSKHINEGEKNTPHRGHPSCKLCARIFFNQDELLVHMARDHYHCHFCGRSSSGLRIYFLDYDSLRNHFKAQHYLCERGNCKNEQFTSAFENDIDFQMHIVNVHGNPAASMRGSEARQQRTILLDAPSYRPTRPTSPIRNLRQNLPPNAVITTLPMAVANSTLRNRPSDNQNSSQNIVPSRPVPSRSEFPSLSKQESSYPLSNSTNINQNTTTNSNTIAGPSFGSAASFVRTMGGCRHSSRVTESDFPPLPDQPRSKQNKKSSSSTSKAPRQQTTRQPQSIDQLFSASLALGSHQSSKKNSNQKPPKQRPIKFQIS